jgi:hypothetical protein
MLALIAVLSILALGGRDRGDVADFNHYGGLPLALAGAAKLLDESVSAAGIQYFYSNNRNLSRLSRLRHYSKRPMPSLWSNLSK